jgi:hypothetical protein
LAFYLKKKLRQGGLVTQPTLEFSILLPQAPECWDDRTVTRHQAFRLSTSYPHLSKYVLSNIVKITFNRQFAAAQVYPLSRFDQVENRMSSGS